MAVNKKELLDQEILKLLSQDYRIEQIAKELKLSKSTIEKRIFNLKTIYEVNTVHGLIFKYSTEI